MFLALYSYVLLTNLTHSISHTDYALLIWVFTIFSEEFRQVMSVFMNKLKNHNEYLYFHNVTITAKLPSKNIKIYCRLTTTMLTHW